MVVGEEAKEEAGSLVRGPLQQSKHRRKRRQQSRGGVEIESTGFLVETRRKREREGAVQSPAGVTGWTEEELIALIHGQLTPSFVLTPYTTHLILPAIPWGGCLRMRN